MTPSSPTGRLRMAAGHVRLDALTRPVQVLVEGEDEREFLRRAVGSNARLQFQVFGGRPVRSEKKDAVGLLVDQPGFSGTVDKVVILLDADDDAAQAFREAVDGLAHAGLPTPDSVGKPAAGKFRELDIETEVLVLPGDGKPGCLETLFLRSLDGDARLKCVDAMITCWRQGDERMSIALQDGDSTSIGNEKLRVQAWLARYTDRGYTLLKSSFDRKPPPWNLQHEAFQPLLAYLLAL